MSSFIVRFYKIVNNVDDKCYVGSTKQTLNRRFAAHKCHHYTSRILFDNYGFSNCTIVLLEEVEVQSRKEQLMKERQFIERYAGKCVNTRIPIRSNEEIKERVKAWNDSHKDYQKERWKVKGDEYNRLRKAKRYEAKKSQINSVKASEEHRLSL